MNLLAGEILDELDLIASINYVPHAGQRDFHESKARFRILAAGRRSGKSQAAVNEAITFALSHNHAVVWVVAPTYSQAMINWRMFKQFLPHQLIKESHITEKYLELTNGSTIWIKSGDNPDTLRGEGLDFLIVDEAAIIKKDVWEEALRPALSDKQGKAVFISTPAGHNWFFDLWIRGQDSAYDNYESWRLPTSANPHIAATEIEEARQTLPELVYRQEYLSEFLDDIGAVFRGVERCVKNTFSEPQPGETYIMGVDLAKYQDFTVLCVMDSKGCLAAFDRFNQIDWNFQKQRIINMAQKYKAKIIIDSTGVGDPIFEDLRRVGLDIEGYKFTNESKKQLIEGLSIAIEQQKISYPDIPELINELRIFGYKYSAGGTISYNAPPGYHDDIVIALSLAQYGFQNSMRPALVILRSMRGIEF